MAEGHLRQFLFMDPEDSLPSSEEVSIAYTLIFWYHNFTYSGKFIYALYNYTICRYKALHKLFCRFLKLYMFVTGIVVSRLVNLVWSVIR